MRIPIARTGDPRREKDGTDVFEVRGTLFRNMMIICLPASFTSVRQKIVNMRVLGCAFQSHERVMLWRRRMDLVFVERFLLTPAKHLSRP